MSHSLRFGAFPLGLAGGPGGVAAGPPDDLERVQQAFVALAGDGPPLLVRMYVPWSGAASTSAALAQVAQLAAAPVDWDLVLTYRDRDGDVQAWARFVDAVVTAHGSRFDSIQVTGEANIAHIPDAADGAFPRATEALATGIVVAAEARRRVGASAAIGFAVGPEPDPAAGDGFWSELARRGGAAFAAGLDYVGLDMYPDVFGAPIPLDQIDTAVDRLLRSLRSDAMPIAGIDADTPIRICENGWPTGPQRSEERQADVLETIIRAVHARKDELNVTHWELFTLRDADSSQPDLFHNFGVLHDDYSPKPAFDRLRHLIAELR